MERKKIGNTLTSKIRAAFLVSAMGLSACDNYNQYDLTPPKNRPQYNLDRKSIELIIDTSGSMDAELGGKRKMDSAKKSAIAVLDDYNAHHSVYNDLEVGLICFDGGDGVKQLVSVQPFNYDILRKKIEDLEANGNTPLGLSLATAERDLDRNSSGASKSIVLLTDGENSTGKDPYAIYNDIIQTNKTHQDLITGLYVIAFDTNRQNFYKLEELGAKIYEAGDETALIKAFKDNTEVLLEK